MRLDHIAYRVANKEKTAQFFIEAFGYRIQTEFEIEFDDKSKAKCIALEPPEKAYVGDHPFIKLGDITDSIYHMAPEIFISDGSPDSIVGKWVSARNGIGGIHHLAYQVDSVEKIVQEWKDKGYAEFSSDEPLKCPGLTQIFTKPSELTGVIIEFIERTDRGFCQESVKSLMVSTKDL